MTVHMRYIENTSEKNPITLRTIQIVLKSLEKELDYKYPKITLHSDLSGRVKGNGLLLFSFFHVDQLTRDYMHWRKNTGGVAHKKRGEKIGRKDNQFDIVVSPTDDIYPMVRMLQQGRLSIETEEKIGNKLLDLVRSYIDCMRLMTDQEAQDFVDEHGFEPTPAGFGWKFEEVLGEIK